MQFAMYCFFTCNFVGVTKMQRVYGISPVLYYDVGGGGGGGVGRCCCFLLFGFCGRSIESDCCNLLRLNVVTCSKLF